MDYTTFHSRIIALFLQGQRLPHRKILEQCKLSVTGEALVIECPNQSIAREVWQRTIYIAKLAPRLGVRTIRVR